MRHVAAVCLRQVKEVCVMVSRRSAAIVAACLAGLLRHIGRDGRCAHMPAHVHFREDAEPCMRTPWEG